MKALRIILFLILLVSTLVGSVHASIRFNVMDLDAAIALAKQDNKYVFVDTYASWCGPYKVMNRVFEESEVSNYFNANFINVKIDMEGPPGDKRLYDYEGVWLPTLLIIDGSGMVLSKIDQLISGSELVK